MYKLTSCYTINIQHGTEMIFNEGWLGEENFQKLKDNAVSAMNRLHETEKIGVLVTRQDFEYSELSKKYGGCQNIYNIYSHIYEDRSNWVTVAEFKDFLKTMTYIKPYKF